MSADYAIGISYGHHESSCCLASSNAETLYLREEWLSRVKGDHRFPALSLDLMAELFPKLQSNLRAVCLFEKPLRNWLGSGLESGLSDSNYLGKIRQFKNTNLFFEKEIKRQIRSNYEILYCPHHLSHALTTSSFMKATDKATLHVVLDGYGDATAGMIMLEKEGEITELARIAKSNSLGLLYSALTDWSGFCQNEDEYKVMALSAYGEPRYLDLIKTSICCYDRELDSIYVNREFFDFSDISQSGLTEKFVKEFGAARSQPIDSGNIEFRNLCDVICSFQAAIEIAVLTLIERFLAQTSGVVRVALSGGLFHNSRLVGYLSEHLSKPIFVCPSPGDAGSSIGASRFASIHLGFDTDHEWSPFCGPRTSSLEQYDHLFSPITSEAGKSETFRTLLNDGHVIGTYAGSCEVGPRALGSRSLICDGNNLQVAKELNTKLKARESFRPLAPVLSERYANQIFKIRPQNIENTRWMGMLVWLNAASENKHLLPFIHQDGSARVQLVPAEYPDNPGERPPREIIDYANEVGPLINTSFNIAGDPIIFSPEDCYLNSRRLGIAYVMTDENIYRVRT